MTLHSVRLRAALYVLIAVLGAVQAGLKDEMTNHDWITLSIGAIMAGLTTLRAFMDRSVARVEGNPDTENNGPILHS